MVRLACWCYLLVSWIWSAGVAWSLVYTRWVRPPDASMLPMKMTDQEYAREALMFEMHHKWLGEHLTIGVLLLGVGILFAIWSYLPMATSREWVRSRRAVVCGAAVLCVSLSGVWWVWPSFEQYPSPVSPWEMRRWVAWGLMHLAALAVLVAAVACSRSRDRRSRSLG